MIFRVLSAFSSPMTIRLEQQAAVANDAMKEPFTAISLRPLDFT
jgi:hypothetical protein